MKKSKFSNLFFLFGAFIVLMITYASCSAPEPTMLLEERTDSTEVYIVKYTNRPDSMVLGYPTIEKTGRSTVSLWGAVPIYKLTLHYNIDEKYYTDGAVSAITQILHDVAEGGWKEFAMSGDSLVWERWTEPVLIQYLEEQLEYWE